MVHNGSVPHDVLHQLAQEGGMLEKGEEDLKKKSEIPRSEYLQGFFKTNIHKDRTDTEKHVLRVL